MKAKPQITRQVEEKGNIIVFEAIKKVVKAGNGGAITMPKKMVGKFVNVVYSDEELIETRLRSKN